MAAMAAILDFRSVLAIFDLLVTIFDLLVTPILPSKILPTKFRVSWPFGIGEEFKIDFKIAVSQLDFQSEQF